MTTFLFVRHGETDWNREGRLQGTRDIPLNDEGRHQARRLARAWDLGGDVLISSPLLRARETAEILGASLGLLLRSTDFRLVERGFGQSEGLTLAERRSRYPDGTSPGEETTEIVRARARSFLDSMTLEHPGRTIIVVSHGALINAVLSLVSHGEVGTGKTSLANTSVSRIEYSATGWTVASVGQTFAPASLGLTI